MPIYIFTVLKKSTILILTSAGNRTKSLVFVQDKSSKKTFHNPLKQAETTRNKKLSEKTFIRVEKGYTIYFRVIVHTEFLG